jgi:predicted nucleic acid-binding Zn ribbon protein
LFSTILHEARDPDTLVGALQGLWSHLAGEEISAHSRPTAIHGTTLTVEVVSGRWARELAGLEQMLVERVNRFLDTRLIDRIEFRKRLGQ